MKYEKTVYFVTKEKKVKHVGFLADSQMHLVESEEVLSELGFSKDPALVKKTDDSVYIFSSHLPQNVIDRWFTQILNQKLKLKKAENEEEGTKKVARAEVTHKKVKSKMRANKKAKRESLILKTHDFSKSNPVNKDRGKKIQNLNLKQKTPLVYNKKPPMRKKTIDALREEVKAQRRWKKLVPTCGECAFWEKRYLELTDQETGKCQITGNFVSPEKKACSEFEKR
ncbi:MAG: hypothetical protein AYK18_10315 [Theionarchaea archaeon DG-70]|nr:MAG: hypothetical protein AYK18_10315 [Theionarchaea archaeon DG-70]